MRLFLHSAFCQILILMLHGSYGTDGLPETAEKSRKFPVFFSSFGASVPESIFRHLGGCAIQYRLPQKAVEWRTICTRVMNWNLPDAP